MRLFETNKYERYTELGMAIEKLMVPACATAFAFELGNGASCRVAMVRVAHNNPFTVQSVQFLRPDATDVTQEELDCLWMLAAMDISMTSIL